MDKNKTSEKRVAKFTFGGRCYTKVARPYKDIVGEKLSHVAESKSESGARSSKNRKSICDSQC